LLTPQAGAVHNNMHNKSPVWRTNSSVSVYRLALGKVKSLSLLGLEGYLASAARSVQSIRFAGKVEVLCRQAPGVVRYQRQLHPVIANVDIWMVACFLCDLSHLVHKAQGIAKVSEAKGTPKFS
jgi:hypothetical protein